MAKRMSVPHRAPQYLYVCVSTSNTTRTRRAIVCRITESDNTTGITDTAHSLFTQTHDTDTAHLRNFRKYARTA
jgi:hypothetical protein